MISKASLCFAVPCLMLSALLGREFMTFQVVCGDRNHILEDVELVIVRKWDPRPRNERYCLGTGIFVNTVNTLHLRNQLIEGIPLNTGMSPDWIGLLPLLDMSARKIAHAEWATVPCPPLGADLQDESLTPEEKLEEAKEVAEAEADLDDTSLQKQLEAAKRLVSDNANHPKAIQTLLSLMRDSNSDLAASAMRILGEIGQFEGFEELLRSDDIVVREKAVLAIRYSDADRSAVLPKLIPLLDDPGPHIRRLTIGLIPRMSLSPEQAAETLRPLVKDPDSEVREAVADVLSMLSPPNRHALNLLHELLGDESADVQISARLSLSWLVEQHPELKEELKNWLVQDPRPQSVHLALILMLPDEYDATLVEILASYLNDEDETIRRLAIEALDSEIDLPDDILSQIAERLVDEKDVRTHAAAILARHNEWSPEVLATLIAELESTEIFDTPAAELLIRRAKENSETANALRRLLKVEEPRLIPLRHRAAACLLLAGRYTHLAQPEIIIALKDPYRTNREEALRALGRAESIDDPVLSTVLELLESVSANFDQVRATLTALAPKQDSVVAALRLRLGHRKALVRARAAACLAPLFPNDLELHQLVIDLFNQSDPDVLWEAEVAAESLTPDGALIKCLSERIQLGYRIPALLGSIGQNVPEWTDERLLRDLGDFDSRIRERAVRVLCCRKTDKTHLDPAILQTLTAMQDSPHPWLRQAARRTMSALVAD
ncbi:MAG TPA: HEAT repeat domain-containing protein [Planctomycetaceae bacterium]|nr:HEAT repeat domain-containing protein [Planctomycetaceae bacterium]